MTGERLRSAVLMGRLPREHVQSAALLGSPAAIDAGFGSIPKGENDLVSVLSCTAISSDLVLDWLLDDVAAIIAHRSYLANCTGGIAAFARKMFSIVRVHGSRCEAEQVSSAYRALSAQVSFVHATEFWTFDLVGGLVTFAANCRSDRARAAFGGLVAVEAAQMIAADLGVPTRFRQDLVDQLLGQSVWASLSRRIRRRVRGW